MPAIFSVTKDVLYQKSLPYGAGGFGQSAFKTWANVGETRNTGWEIGITSRNIQSRDFSWTTTLNWSTNDEEVVKTTSEGPLQFGDYYLIPGEAVKTYYGYKYLGIWGTAEAEEARCRFSIPPTATEMVPVSSDKLPAQPPA